MASPETPHPMPVLLRCREHSRPAVGTSERLTGVVGPFSAYPLSMVASWPVRNRQAPCTGTRWLAGVLSSTYVVLTGLGSL